MKNRCILPILLTFVILSLGFVTSANTVTLVTPAQDDRIAGATYNLNATVDTNTLNLTFAEFFYDDGSSNISIANVTNESVVSFNHTWATTGIIDYENIVVWVNIWNVTALVTSDSSTGVDVDNGLPSATIGSTTFTNNTAQVAGTTFTFAIDADNARGIDNCSLIILQKGTGTLTTSAVSASGNACSTSTTPTALSLSANHDYIMYMEATDANSNKTNSSARTLQVTLGSAGGSSGGNQVQSQSQGSQALKSTFQNFIDGIVGFFKRMFSFGKQ